MSDASLSQEELDTLLSSNSTSESSNDGLVSEIVRVFSFVSSLMEGVFKGEISDVLSIRSEGVNLVRKEDFLSGLDDKYVVDVSTPFLSGVTGGHFFILEQESVLPLASGIVGQSISSLEGAGLLAISEIFSKIGNGLCSGLLKVLGREIQIGNSDVKLVEKGLSRIPSGDLVSIKYVLSYQGSEVSFYEVMDSAFTESLMSVTKTGEVSSDSGVTVSDRNVQGEITEREGVSLSDTETNGTNTKASSSSYTATPNVKGVQLPNLTQQKQGMLGSSVGNTQNISLLMDVSMELTVELGRTRWQVKDILGMGEGTIVELDKLAGEPVDILVNRNLIARGEVVVIDENFGVRVTEIVSSLDRISDRRI